MRRRSRRYWVLALATLAVAPAGCQWGKSGPLNHDARLERKIAEQARNDPFPPAGKMFAQ